MGPDRQPLSMSPSHEPLLAFGWSDRVQAAYSPLDAAGLAPARVVSVDRGARRVVTAEGPRLVVDHDSVVGDWVGLDGERVAGRIDRWSSLERLDPDGRRQVLAANVDLVLIAA